ncbi:MAG: hypothetical protein J6I85_01255 [Clostridia bacterium]|nr:hypothetical protein [Clostridia bacterium]
MAYKKTLASYNANVVYATQNKKDSALLAMHNNELRRVREFIGYIEEIVSRAEGEMAILKIRFAENKIIETRAYIDDTIQEGVFVSIWGFFDLVKDEIKLFCKCGIQRVLCTATQCKEFDLRYTYRMGYVELSEIEISPVYVEKEGVRKLDDSGLYAFSGNLKEIENSLEKNSIVDTTGPKKRIKFY